MVVMGDDLSPRENENFSQGTEERCWDSNSGLSKQLHNSFEFHGGAMSVSVQTEEHMCSRV